MSATLTPLQQLEILVQMAEAKGLSRVLVYAPLWKELAKLAKQRGELVWQPQRGTLHWRGVQIVLAKAGRKAYTRRNQGVLG